MSGPKKPARRSSAKAKSAAPTLRSTSGAGFNFEDLIGAWQLVKTLAGEKVAGIEVTATKLQAQVSTLGWRMDDLLLTGEHDGVLRRLAISAKGNQQVSASSLPSDFVHRAWEQWRDPNGPFDPKTDGLALVTIGSNPEFNEAWREVKNACSESDTALTLSRIRATPRQSRVFDSVQKPSDAAEGSDDETIALIRCLHVLPTDLQLAYSETENQAIAQCRRLLVSGEAAEADELWQRLVDVATEVRLAKGTVSIHSLLSQLRGKFELLHHPDFARDWQTLANITSDYRARVETELTSGYAVPRLAERASLKKSIAENAVTVVFGESGNGKSSIVKSVLDNELPQYNQVWLGPEELKAALSAARRSSLPLRNNLAATLNATVRPTNVLVLDSAERIESTESVVVRTLLQAIAPNGPDAVTGAWRIVVVTQPQAWDEESILTGQRAELVELKQLSIGEAKLALARSPSLGWLTAHEETVAALTNLRTLSWVIKAGAALGATASGLASHTAIADRLWRHWTQGRPEIQAMMMRLAQREAAFERSFALTDLLPVDTVTFAQRPTELPLRLNERTNRVEFEHDLAADWSRFQYLKQIHDDTTQWGKLASNPLWTNALRMLGQFLLRQPAASGTGWDEARRSAAGADNTLAGDILLDALYLDPEADRFLTERIDMLLEGNASTLTRLLTRFHHTATVPSAGARQRGSTLGLYLEVKFRSVIFGRWPPVVRFLIAQRERLNGFVSSALAQVIETWLTRTPLEIEPGVPMPFRRELAELALSMARTVQVQKGQGIVYVDREILLYSAPLAGAADLPEEVGRWALELAGRRDVDPDVVQRINEARRKQSAEHAERLKTDPLLKTREERKKKIPPFVGAFNQRLPPWPLGASRRVDMDFRNACLEAGALQRLMEIRPEIAAEVLLALIIEDRPERGQDRYEANLGLDFPRNAYPTAFWKSPFFQFLQSAPSSALGALIRLGNFCTERWVAARTNGGERPTPNVTLIANEKAPLSLPGWHEVFGWVQANDPMHNGNLYCALDALERWLIIRIDAGEDISVEIDRLLAEGNSTAFASVLVNVAKYQPTLLAGPLAPLLTVPALYFWDSERVKHIKYNFIGSSWLEAGDRVFEFARDWTLAPHRRRKLVDVAIELMLVSPDVARRLQALIAGWTLPDDPKAALEYQLLFASLDQANYPIVVNPQTGEATRELVYPEVLLAAVRAWQGGQSQSLEYLALPDRCRDRLNGGQALRPEEAAYLAKFLSDTEAVTDDDRAGCAIAAASTLLILGSDWLAINPHAQERSRTLIRAAIADVPTDVDNVRRRRYGATSVDLAFAARVMMHLWLEDRSNVECEKGLVRLMTIGDVRVASVVMSMAVARREELGHAWWRLLYLGVLWSGLVLLMPRHGDEDAAARVWRTWLARLRRFRLTGVAGAMEDLDIKRVATAIGRLRFDRDMRRYLAGDEYWRGEPRRNLGDLIDVQFLDGLFGWLLEGNGTGDRSLDEHLTLLIWDYDATRAKQHAKTERFGEYDLPSQNLGYHALMKLAALAIAAPDDEQRSIWEPVLVHGPAAHFALQHFVRGLFLHLGKIENAAAFEGLWRSMSEYALAADWSQRGLWFHGEKLICDILGFGNETALSRLPAGAILHMRGLYERWAATHLDRDEDCLVRFAHFLTTGFGAPLLLDGLCWIAAMLDATKASGHWYREGTGESLVHLATSALNSSSGGLVRDSKARQALIDILALLAEKNVPGALSLQDRVRLVR